MDQDWARLGKALSRARKRGDRTQRDVAAALSISLATVQNIERGKSARGEPFTRVTPTVRAYAQLMDWTPESIEAVLGGGEPTLLPGQAEAPAAEDRRVPEGAGLPLRIVERLERPGELVDSAVIPLTDSADMVVVVKGKPTATREQMRAALEVWLRTQPQLQSRDDDEEPAAGS